MKRIFLLAVMIGSMAFASLAAGQQQDDSLFSDKKDTISIDDMNPVFYEAEEENASSCSSTAIIAIVAGVVVVVAAGAYFFVKKRKKLNK